MTPLARQRHIENLKKALLDSGLIQDRFGKFKLPSEDTYRIHFKDNNFRLERKVGDRWILSKGGVLVQTTVDQMIAIKARMVQFTRMIV